LFKNDDVLIIDSRWVLRNDKDYLVLYLIDTSEAKTWILPPLLSYAVAFINGKNSYSRLISLIGRVFGTDDFGKSKQLTDRVLSILNDRDSIVRKRMEEPKEEDSNIFETKDFFIPLERYRFPENARLKYPTKVNLFVTKKCCAKCIYCYADLRKDNSDELLSFDEWRKIIDQCLSMGIWNIEVLGGDQLSCREGVAVTKYLMSKKVPVFLSTKCEVTESLAKELLSAGFLDKPRGPPHRLQFSIDSLKPEVADFMTNTVGFVERISRSVECCTNHGILPKIKSVLTPYNFMEMENIVSFFSTKGVKDFQFVCYSLSNFQPNEELLLSDDMKKWIHECYTYELVTKYPELHIVVQDEYRQKSPTFEERVDTWHKRARCTGGYSSLTILPTGKVVICEQMPQEKKFIVGDIRKEGLMGVWLGEEIEKFLFPPKEAFVDTSCEKCLEYADCHYNAGFCYRDALFAYGTVLQAPPNCPYQKKKGRSLI